MDSFKHPRHIVYTDSLTLSTLSVSAYCDFYLSVTGISTLTHSLTH